MTIHARFLADRADGVVRRAKGLLGLRGLVALDPRTGPWPAQWRAIEAELGHIAGQILSRVRRAEVRGNADALAQLELELARAYGFYDTFVDLLTQRGSPTLGPLLKGCDVLARDALDVDHPAAARCEAPLVYCDRGIGASILREGVRASRTGRNPVPLIQIPYARLEDKLTLTSLLHEAGHEAAVRLGFRGELALVFGDVLDREAPAVREHFVRWASEIGPDFWAFGHSGMAHAMTLSEVLPVPGSAMFLPSDGPHPPPYLRALLAFALCREAHGRGPWDDRRDAWLAAYDVRRQPADVQAFSLACLRALPRIVSVFFSRRLRCLGGDRTLASLLGIDDAHPRTLLERLDGHAVDSESFRRLRPARQLLLLRLMHDLRPGRAAAVRTATSRWLVRLGQPPPRDRPTPSRPARNDLYERQSAWETQ